MSFKERLSWIKLLWNRPRGLDRIPLLQKILGTLAFLFDRFDENQGYDGWDVGYEGTGVGHCDYGEYDTWDTYAVLGSRYTIYSDSSM